MEARLRQVFHFFLLILKLFFSLFWPQASISVFSHESKRSMHQNDPDNVGNFPVHSARVVVAFWAHFLQPSSVQTHLGINAQIRNHQSTTGICVWLLILCCLWNCPKQTAGITADLDNCVDLLALGVAWLCLGVQLICGMGVAWLLEALQCTPRLAVWCWILWPQWIVACSWLVLSPRLGDQTWLCLWFCLQIYLSTAVPNTQWPPPLEMPPNSTVDP